MPITDESEEVVFINEDVNEVLGQTPVWIMRWGNILLFAIIVVLLALSNFVHYPDVINGKAEIIPAGNQFVYSPAHETEIKKIFISDGQQVKKNSILFLLTDKDNPRACDTVLATIAGTVHIQRLLQAGSALPPATCMLRIKDKGSSEKILIYTSSYRAGKINTGQKVYISTDRYPREEFGELEARVIAMPLEEEKGMVTLEAGLTKGMTTSFGRELDFATSTSGAATIIIDRKTVFAKLFPFL